VFMNIGRQSMYDTFADKRSLFLKALKLYVGESLGSIVRELEMPGPVLSPVQNTLLSFAERRDLSSADGCMGIDAICEFGQRDSDVTRLIREASRTQRAALVRALCRAKSEGELSAEAELEDMWIFSKACSPE
jgi:TetR/AcrR family transcriptional regulator, transcriptional repressor for nem operon